MRAGVVGLGVDVHGMDGYPGDEGGQLVRAQLSLPQPAPDQIRISNSGLLKWAEKNNTKIKMFLLFTVMRIQIRPGLN